MLAVVEEDEDEVARLGLIVTEEGMAHLMEVHHMATKVTETSHTAGGMTGNVNRTEVTMTLLIIGALHHITPANRIRTTRIQGIHHNSHLNRAIRLTRGEAHPRIMGDMVRVTEDGVVHLLEAVTSMDSHITLEGMEVEILVVVGTMVVVVAAAAATLGTEDMEEDLNNKTSPAGMEGDTTMLTHEGVVVVDGIKHLLIVCSVLVL